MSASWRARNYMSGMLPDEWWGVSSNSVNSLFERGESNERKRKRKGREGEKMSVLSMRR